MLTEQDAIDIARDVASERGWPWEMPLRVILIGTSWIERKILRMRAQWDVCSNTGSRGRNVRVIIDAESGEATGAGFAPR